ncbi:MAG: exosortase-associated EpsI family protein, partial [Burkholderiales bacterium]
VVRAPAARGSGRAGGPAHAARDAAPRAALGLALGALAMSAAVLGARHLADGALDTTPRPGFDAAARATLGPFEAVGPSAVPAYGGQRDAVRGRWPDGVEFALGYWAAQSEGSEMVAQGNRLVPERAGLVALGPTPTAAGDGLAVDEWVLRGAGGTLRGWTWYVADGRPSTGGAAAKLAALGGTLAGRGDHAALAWLVVDASDDAARDRARLSARASAVQAFLAGWTRPVAGAAP